jgi:predicted dithiol-disulfide oxidoreductase (DUF899 family)
MTDTASEIHGLRFPNESAAYRKSRNELLRAEMALRREIEAVAAKRRALAPGGEVPQDYVFEEGDDARKVKLSELFGDKPTLLAYSYMYGPKMEQPCPSCTSMLDSMEGAARHVERRASLVAIARSPIQRFRAFAREKGWMQLRLLSSANNSYNADYHGESAEGRQRPVLNVFSRKDGAIRHVYATELAFAPSESGQDPRHVDLIWPLWGLLDFTPEGRGADFRPKLSYA